MLHDCGAGAANDRILIFGRHQHLGASSSGATNVQLFMDGTFKVTPPLYSQGQVKKISKLLFMPYKVQAFNISCPLLTIYEQFYKKTRFISAKNIVAVATSTRKKYVRKQAKFPNQKSICYRYSM